MSEVHDYQRLGDLDYEYWELTGRSSIERFESDPFKITFRNGHSFTKVAAAVVHLEFLVKRYQARSATK